MLFNSFEFLLFLPIVFLLYWFVFGAYRPKWLSWLANLKMQNLFIVVVSYIFYGWWDWHFLVLIALTSFCSWASGLLIEKFRTVEGGNNVLLFNKLPKIISAANIILNLAILGFFKYYNFFVESFISAFSAFGITLHASTLNIILPVGISFYTFQALSYSIDVYRQKIAPTKDIVAFFAFLSFFPQLVAGPIERATNLLPQFLKPRTFDYAKAVDGCRQMLWGFFKKIVIADNCAVYVNQVFENYQDQTGSTLLLAAIFFTFQIYGDFSGYSDIAIGCARLFGINLVRNFNFPYFSRDIAEFWRRWHISLTTWFRDYIYIPLGGSRTTKAKVIRNTFIIFLVSGFWHGANWTFIAWGAYHALLFLPLILLGKNRKYTNDATWREIPKILLTFGLAVIGWIIFRAENITQAWEYIITMCNHTFFSMPDTSGQTALFLCIAILVFVEWLQRNKQHALQIKLPIVIRWSIYFAILFLIFCFGGNVQNFIYFQF